MQAEPVAVGKALPFNNCFLIWNNLKKFKIIESNSIAGQGSGFFFLISFTFQS